MTNVRKEVGLTKSVIKDLSKKAEKLGMKLKNYMEFVLINDSKK